MYRVLSRASGAMRKPNPASRPRAWSSASTAGRSPGAFSFVDVDEERREGFRARPLDRGLVHPGGVEVGDLLLDRSLRPVGLRRGLLEDLLQDVAVAVGDLFERAVARAVRRDRVTLQPAPVRVLVEVLARLRRTGRSSRDRAPSVSRAAQSGRSRRQRRREGRGRALHHAWTREASDLVPTPARPGANRGRGEGEP